MRIGLKGITPLLAAGAAAVAIGGRHGGGFRGGYGHLRGGYGHFRGGYGPRFWGWRW